MSCGESKLERCDKYGNSKRNVKNVVKSARKNKGNGRGVLRERQCGDRKEQSKPQIGTQRNTAKNITEWR